MVAILGRKTLQTFAGDDDDVAFVELQPNEADHVALCFRDQRFLALRVPGENQQPL